MRWPCWSFFWVNSVHCSRCVCTWMGQMQRTHFTAGYTLYNCVTNVKKKQYQIMVKCLNIGKNIFVNRYLGRSLIFRFNCTFFSWVVRVSNSIIYRASKTTFYLWPFFCFVVIEMMESICNFYVIVLYKKRSNMNTFENFDFNMSIWPWNNNHKRIHFCCCCGIP